MVDGVPGSRRPGGPATGRPRAGSLQAALAASLRDPRTLAFALLGPLADIDFLFGIHSRQTHSIGAVLVVLLIVWAWGRARRRVPGGDRSAWWSAWWTATPDPYFRFAVACAGAYGSHVLFDWMGNDTTPPIGIMALWPLSDGFYQSQLYVFEAISRRHWLPNFWTHNLMAVGREILILAPPAAALWWWRVRRDRPGRG
jgi:hypothetical protein